MLSIHKGKGKTLAAQMTLDTAIDFLVGDS